MIVSVNDVLIGLLLSASKFTVGYLSGIISPSYPSLVRFRNLSSTVNSSDLYADITLLSTSDRNYLKMSLLLATKDFHQIVCSPFVGCVIGACGALIFLLIGAIFQIFTLVVYGLAEFFSWFILGRILEGIASTSISCACCFLVAFRFKDPGPMGLMYGINGLSLCIGSVLGATYGNNIYQPFVKKAAFYLVILLFFVEIILTAVVKKRIDKSAMETEPQVELLPASTVVDTNEGNLLKPEGNGDVTVQNSQIPGTPETTEISSGHSIRNVLMFFKDEYVLICIGTFPVVSISIPLLFSTLPLHMEWMYGASKYQQGLVWMFSLVGYALSCISGYIINTRFATRRDMILIVYTWIQTCVMVCVEPMPVWWAIIVPICTITHVTLVMEIVVLPILRTIVERRHHSRFGIMSGIVVMTVAVTGLLGSFIGPNLMRLIGFRWMMIMICVLNGAYSPLYQRLRMFC